MAHKAPQLSRSRAQDAHGLFVQGRPVEGRRILYGALDLHSLPPADYEQLGFVAAGVGEHELSHSFFSKVVELAPRDGLAYYNLATACRNIGQITEAEHLCNEALSLDERLSQAGLLRAHLRTQTLACNHIDELRRHLTAANRMDGSAIFLHYALGKELEDVGDYDLAFDHYCRGALLRRTSFHYNVNDDINKLARIREAFSENRLKEAPALDRNVRDGFIMGLPRSGTTLIERVLTGHPSVVSNGETDNLMAALLEATPHEGGDVFDRVARAEPTRAVAAYRRRAEPRMPYATLLEKLPLNYLYAGALRLTMPEARIVLVERTPADNALAMYSTLFGSGYPFSYDLEELAAYVIGYRELINHWASTIGDQLLCVDYQAFVSAPEHEGARIAAHFKIPWQPGMTAVENNHSASATASASQVRRPIYTSSIGRSRGFQRHLVPFRDRLERAGIDPDEGLAH